MDLEQRVLIEHACTRLCHEYARAIDFRDYDNFPLLFTEDAVLDVGNLLEGRAAILASVMRRPDELRSRHVISNITIDVLNEDEARGTAYLTLYRYLGKASLQRDPIPFIGPAAIGHYEDRYQRDAGGWLFQRRTLFLAFRNSDLLPKRS